MGEMSELHCPNCGGTDFKVQLTHVNCARCYEYISPDKWLEAVNALLARAEKAEAMVERMIEAGGEIVDEAQLQEPDVSEFREAWQALVTEWEHRNDKQEEA